MTTLNIKLTKSDTWQIINLCEYISTIDRMVDHSIREANGNEGCDVSEMKEAERHLGNALSCLLTELMPPGTVDEIWEDLHKKAKEEEAK